MLNILNLCILEKSFDKEHYRPTLASKDCVINGCHIAFCHLKLLFPYCLTDVWFSIHMYRNAEAKLFHCILFSDSSVAQGCQFISVFLPFSLLLNHFDPEGN